LQNFLFLTLELFNLNALVDCHKIFLLFCYCNTINQESFILQVLPHLPISLINLKSEGPNLLLVILNSKTVLSFIGKQDMYLRGYGFNIDLLIAILIFSHQLPDQDSWLLFLPQTVAIFNEIKEC